MIPISRDTKNQPYIEWHQVGGEYKRAWVQHREADKDWANTGTYLNVVRTDAERRPAGNATDFPIFRTDLTDEQILEACVAAVCGITGCKLT